jgi:hypothetical protein
MGCGGSWLRRGPSRSSLQRIRPPRLQPLIAALVNYVLIAFKKYGRLHLRSRNENDFSWRYPGGMEASPDCQPTR